MWVKAFRKSYQLARIALCSAGALTAAACATPSLNILPGGQTAPTVEQVENNLTCELVDAMHDKLNPANANSSDKSKKDAYALWRNVYLYNFQAQVNLTLFVTQTEGLSPTLNFITPLTNLGGPIKTIVESSNGVTNPMNATTNTNNLTGAVGFQLTGVQDNNHVQTYMVDLHRLYDGMPDVMNKGVVVKGQYSLCHSGDRNPPNKTRPATDDKAASANGPYSLKGNLGLAAAIDQGLRDMQANRFAPMTAGSSVSAKAGQQSSNASVSQAVGASSFSKKIDFSLTWGGNGGPSWTELKFKGPAGGSGANSQLLNYSRQKQDTATATFWATCKSDLMIEVVPRPNMNDPDLFFEPAVTPAKNPPTDGGFTSYEIDVFKRPGADGTSNPTVIDSDPKASKLYPHAPKEYVLTVSIPTDKTGLQYTYSSTGTGIFSIDTLDHQDTPPDKRTDNKNGTITWTAFGTVTPQGTSYSLRGTLADAQSGTAIGYIYASLGPDHKVKRLALSTNGLAALEAEETTGPVDYWDSLASCATSGPFLPSGLNFLQQVPPAFSNAIQQGRF